MQQGGADYKPSLYFSTRRVPSLATRGVTEYRQRVNQNAVPRKAAFVTSVICPLRTTTATPPQSHHACPPMTSRLELHRMRELTLVKREERAQVLLQHTALRVRLHDGAQLRVDRLLVRLPLLTRHKLLQIREKEYIILLIRSETPKN